MPRPPAREKEGSGVVSQKQGLLTIEPRFRETTPDPFFSSGKARGRRIPYEGLPPADIHSTSNPQVPPMTTPPDPNPRRFYHTVAEAEAAIAAASEAAIAAAPPNLPVSFYAPPPGSDVDPDIYAETVEALVANIAKVYSNTSKNILAAAVSEALNAIDDEAHGRPHVPHPHADRMLVADVRAMIASADEAAHPATSI